MISIVLAEDQGMLRGALGALLSLEDDFIIVGEAANGEEAYELITKHNPDICVMDIEMPIMTGLDVAEKVKQEGQACKIIILTTFARPGYFQRAIQAGVHGYLLKDSPSSELAQYIRKIIEGKRIISPELSLSVWQETNPLTERELDVLKSAAEGKTSKEIASMLFLSNGTVRNYMSEILRKLNATNRVEAISIAKKKGWLK
ncbi:DNA-binding response regulator [Bacillus sp. HMF5848]|uniref:response regulator transcription factor n=1 Tax=Bacillus sp. HMF5848 TaxID=2495421 RepID=UPI000F78D295|nr:response regulator transcription factor [Bacillus sp. HMF5848]RSK29058.1 DNA-binding response regulator [Bacillus sp. HMF5848]